MPKSIVRWICAVALAVAAGSAFAEPVSAGDAKAVRAVIEAQLVQISDGDGVLCLGVYNVARQPDRAWRITGCIVQRQSGRMT